MTEILELQHISSEAFEAMPKQKRYCDGKVKSFVLPEIQIDLTDIFS